MVTSHAIERYIERIQGKQIKDASTKEKLYAYKNVVNMYNRSHLLYEGSLFGTKVYQRYFICGNVVLVTNRIKILTLWKMSNGYIEKIKRINKMNTLLGHLKKQKSVLDVESNKINKVYEYINPYLNGISSDVLIKIEKDRSDIRIKSTELLYTIEALKILITLEFRACVFSKDSREINPIDFYTSITDTNNSGKLTKLKDGFKMLRVILAEAKISFNENILNQIAN